VSSAFAALLQELYVVPEQLTPLIQRTINQTIEFLAALLKQRDLDGSIKLSTARVYAVDDDHSACEMISEGLNNVGLKTKTTMHPSAAVAELAGSRYDLVILDVHLPGLNGFELCSHIRNMALHADTPIIFLTGNDSQENRIESSLRGGNEFLPKPFNLQELALRSLTLIIKSQLKIS
jgi:DNA-binding response OmpR family regulator